MDRTEDYIRQCLSDIPKGQYRERLRSELADHLSLLAGDAVRAGCGEAQAEAEALRQMGDARALNGRFWAEWLRRPERLRHDLARLFSGCLLAGVTFFIGVALVLIPVLFGQLFVFTAGDPAFVSWPWPVIGGAVVYAAAFVPNAMYLRRAFRRRPRRPVLVGVGLLLSWAVGKASAALLFGSFGVPAFSGISLQDVVRSLTGAELPWFRWPLVALSLLGCAALGWLFGRDRKPERMEETKDEEA